MNEDKFNKIRETLVGARTKTRKVLYIFRSFYIVLCCPFNPYAAATSTNSVLYFSTTKGNFKGQDIINRVDSKS